jgi:hypothetical protein
VLNLGASLGLSAISAGSQNVKNNTMLGLKETSLMEYPKISDHGGGTLLMRVPLADPQSSEGYKNHSS